MKELRKMQDCVKEVRDLESSYEDINALIELTEEEEDVIEENINNLLNLGIYSLPTLKISSKADEEDVAEIFVRVNSGGQNLTEKNFIETLIAVYDNDVPAIFRLLKSDL